MLLLGGERLKGGIKRTENTKMDKVLGGRRVGDGRKIGFRQAELAGAYWSRGDGYTGEGEDGWTEPPNPRKTGLAAPNEPTGTPR